MRKLPENVNPQVLLEAACRALGLKIGSVQGFVLVMGFEDGTSGLVHSAVSDLDAFEYVNGAFIAKLRGETVTAEPQ